MMVFGGISISDTHQAESEFVRVELEETGKTIRGRFGVGYGPSMDGAVYRPYEWIEFQGLSQQNGYLIVAADGRFFNCHHFNRTDLLLILDGYSLGLSGPGSSVVLRLRKNPFY